LQKGDPPHPHALKKIGFYPIDEGEKNQKEEKNGQNMGNFLANDFS